MEIKQEESTPFNHLQVKRNDQYPDEISYDDNCLNYLYNIRSELSSHIEYLKEMIFQIKSNDLRQEPTTTTLSLKNNAEEIQIYEEVDKVFSQLPCRAEDNVSTSLNMTTELHSSFQRNYLQLKQELNNEGNIKYKISNHCTKKRGKRGKYLMYSEAFKADCIEEVRRHGNEKEVAKFFNIPQKKLKRWLEIGPKRLEGGGRKVMDPQMEIDLIHWIKSEKLFMKKITGKQIQDKARSLSRSEKFLASKGWLEKFLKKYDIKIEK